MDKMSRYWEENANVMQRVKFERCMPNEEPVTRMKDADRAIYPCCDSNLNFSTATCSEDDCEYGPYKKSTKVARQDPMSHRIIEKRRRDRMNNCLADLSRLIPTDYLKKGRGRIEKTEIIEMAIKHMKHLQQTQLDGAANAPMDHYRLGYQECMSETMRFLVEIEGHFPREPICVRMLGHLQKHADQLSKVAPPTGAASPTNNNNVVLEPNATLPAQLPIRFLKSGNVAELTVPKAEPENSNSCDSHPNEFNSNTVDSFPDKSEDYGNTGGLYKFKNSIKMRFSQDLNAHEVPKRQKLTERSRRGSVTSCFENQSSNQSSPPSSAEPCHNLIGGVAPLHQTPTPPPEDAPPLMKPDVAKNSDDVNFNVPIFVLHTKGAYYLPLTIDYKTLKPYLRGQDILESGSGNVILHPVTLGVNFLINNNNNNYRNSY